MNFYGEITQKVDGKGRVSIPADFRRVLELGDPDWTPGNRPKVRVVWGDPRRKYLECYTISAIRRVEAGILKLPAGSQKRPGFRSRSCLPLDSLSHLEGPDGHGP